MTPEGWAIIIGAVFLGAGQLLNAWISYLKGRDAALAARDAATAARDAGTAAHAAQTAATRAADVSDAQLAQGAVQLEQSQANAAKLETIHQDVNSGATAALAATRSLGQAEGRDQQRAVESHP